MYQDFLIDPDTLEFELLPSRTSSMHWNALKWIEDSPCSDCVKITKIEPSGSGTLLVDIRIRLPFPHPNFTGFDVRGIVMFNGTLNFPTAGKLTLNKFSDDGFLVNAEGYTSLYHPGTLGSGWNGFQGYKKGEIRNHRFPQR